MMILRMGWLSKNTSMFYLIWSVTFVLTDDFCFSNISISRLRLFLVTWLFERTSFDCLLPESWKYANSRYVAFLVRLNVVLCEFILTNQEIINLQAAVVLIWCLNKVMLRLYRCNKEDQLSDGRTVRVEPRVTCVREKPRVCVGVNRLIKIGLSSAHDQTLFLFDLR